MATWDLKRKRGLWAEEHLITSHPRVSSEIHPPTPWGKGCDYPCFTDDETKRGPHGDCDCILSHPAAEHTGTEDSGLPATARHPPLTTRARCGTAGLGKPLRLRAEGGLQTHHTLRWGRIMELQREKVLISCPQPLHVLSREKARNQ